MSDLYPLRFQPLLQNYPWGGHRLATMLGKDFPAHETRAESWEVVDHGEHQSRVAFGPLQATTLRELVITRGPELFGAQHPQEKFPLLFKFLDANDRLSVQVHPSDELAAKLTPPDLGKTEAWVIMHAEPDSTLYAGLKPDIDRLVLERAIQNGTTETCLHQLVPRVGDCFFLEAGTVHALGAGLVVAEIQQSSNVTYRLFDWNRRGSDGQPRALHIAEGLKATNFACGPVAPQSPRVTQWPHVQRLVTDGKFILDRWAISTPQSIGGDGRFHILAVLAGKVFLEGDLSHQPLTCGQTAVLPAVVASRNLVPQGAAVLLDMYLPRANELGARASS